MQTGKPIIDRVRKAIRNGEVVWYSLSEYPWHDDNENIIGTISISRNITDRENLRKAVCLFFTDAAHKLKSPFTVVNGMLGRIIKGQYGKINNESALNALQIVSAECSIVEQRARESLNLVEHLCYKNNIDAASILEDIDVGRDVFNYLVELHATFLEENNVFIDGVMGLIPPGKVFVKANLHKLRSVIEEFMFNGVKYGKIGRDSLNMSYGYWYEPGKLFLNLYTDGVGISEEFLKTGLLCAPFERGSETSELAEGTGLGLYMVDQYMKMMGGGFRCENTPDNHPNCIIWLPVPK
jgi:signal transduction histidine kinase